MRPPLITMISPALDGGIGRNIVNLANSFHALGCRVHVLLNKPRGPYLQLLGADIEVRKLRGNHQFLGVPALGAYLLFDKPDVVLTPVPRQTILALRARRIFRPKTRVYVNVHNTYSLPFAHLSARKRRRRIDKINRYYPRCDGIIAVSNGVADDLSDLTGLPRNEIAVIYNPGVTKELLEQAKAPVEHPWFTEGQPPVLAILARLEIAKNIPLAIAAFEAVRDGVDCRLVIIGEGSLRSKLERRIAESRHARDIALLGHQVNPFRFLSRAALLVLSSRYEGFGNVLVEAMAAGCPIVSTDCPSGPREILDGGRYGELVPVDDVAALADGIRRMLAEPTPQTLLREGSQRFEASSIARKYLARFGLASVIGDEDASAKR